MEYLHGVPYSHYWWSSGRQGYMNILIFYFGFFNFCNNKKEAKKKRGFTEIQTSGRKIKLFHLFYKCEYAYNIDLNSINQ